MLRTRANDSCPDGNQFLYGSSFFGHECVVTALQLSGVIVGFLSILFWLMAQLPQVYRNWRYGEAGKAFSCYFLLDWMLGDVTSLAGTILSHQLSFQIWQAVYFCIMDVILMGQYLSQKITQRMEQGEPLKGVMWEDSSSCSSRSSSVTMCCFLCFLLLTSFLFISPLKLNPALSQGQVLPSSVHYGRTLLSTNSKLSRNAEFIPTQDALIGYVLGCVSASFYILSRVPQIIKNFRHKSVKGLSGYMFILAIMGNITYSLGVFLFSLNPTLGTVVFDLIVLLQFILYRKANVQCEEDEPLICGDYADPVDYSAVG